jgi:hypothetical protein
VDGAGGYAVGVATRVLVAITGCDTVGDAEGTAATRADRDTRLPDCTTICSGATAVGTSAAGAGASMFVHAGILHLLINVVALIQVGLILERLLGQLTFAAMYSRREFSPVW